MWRLCIAAYSTHNPTSFFRSCKDLMIGGLLLEVTWFKPVQDCQVPKRERLFCTRGKAEIGQQNQNVYRGILFSHEAPRGIYRRLLRSRQLGGLEPGHRLGSHQGIRLGNLKYPLRIPPLVKERRLVRWSLTLFYFINLIVLLRSISCYYSMKY